VNLTPTHVCVAAIFERAIKIMALKCLNATNESFFQLKGVKRRREKLEKSSHTLVIRMETGLPNKEIFDTAVSYTRKFQDDINYFAGWKVQSLSLEDQVFITLMKLRQHYTNLHLAKLFHCSTGTIRNSMITLVHLLYIILYLDKVAGLA